MAFQLRGISPKSYDGKMIRFNVWTWHRIWKAFSDFDSSLTKDTEFWYSNSGDVVKEMNCEGMADLIDSVGHKIFAEIATLKVPLAQQHNVEQHTLVAALEFEIEPFVRFLRSCGGFKIT